MKNIAAIKRNNRKIHARKFLSTPEGKAWLDPTHVIWTQA
ncbi:hypothetical protein ExPEC_2940 [Escherichia coli]|nr:hypothetical protein G709_03956 [Escherichia coli HVH 33 (4-2174936)]KDG94813.1 hypothetical protein AE25_03010 [Escherichia coli UCI 66]KQL77392.1 hypothetical protein ExPEC_2940 [Escherichia coli]